MICNVAIELLYTVFFCLHEIHEDKLEDKILVTGFVPLCSCVQDETWEAEKVIQIPWKKVTNWMLPKMPGA